MEVLIDNRQDKVEIEEDIHIILENIVEGALVMERDSLDYEISISFVDNKEIKNLNKTYREIDKSTDVLSFPQENEFSFEGPIILGDIIISLEKALEQAEEFGHSLKREVAYLAAHSMFHLLGYNHISKEDKDIMRSKEKQLMKKMKLFKNN